MFFLTHQECHSIPRAYAPLHRLVLHELQTTNNCGKSGRLIKDNNQ